MRFAMITRRFWPLVGESELMAANLAESFRVSGHDVTVISGRALPAWPSEFSFRGCRVIRLPQKFPAFRIRNQFERATLKLIAEHRDQLDAVFFFQGNAPPFSLIQSIAALGLQVVVRLEPTMLTKTVLSQSTLEKLCAEFASVGNSCRWVTSSQLLAQQLRAIGININCVPDGVRPRSDIKETWDGAALLDEKQLAKDALSRSHPLLRIRPSEKLIMFAGPVTASQDLEKWIKSWKRVVRTIPQAKLWIIGEGNFQQQLWELIIDLNLDNQVVLGGVFDDLSSAMDACDGFLVSDERRIESPFVLQAQQIGVPVIVSLPDPVSPLCAGVHDNVVRAPAEANELGQFMIDFLRGQVSTNEIVKSARSKIEKLHTMETCATNYIKLAQ